MVLTPTYHVFNMYKVHMDATRLATSVASENYAHKDEKIPQVSVSASKDAEGRINISLCNLDHSSAADVELDLRGLAGLKLRVSGTELTASVKDAHNTFEQPDMVAPAAFQAFTVDGSAITAKLSPMSVTVLQVVAE